MRPRDTNHVGPIDPSAFTLSPPLTWNAPPTRQETRSIAGEFCGSALRVMAAPRPEERDEYKALYGELIRAIDREGSKIPGYWGIPGSPTYVEIVEWMARKARGVA